MTEQTTDDIVQGEGEALVPPTPTISAGSEQAGSEETGFDVEAFEERFFSKLDEVLDDKVDARVKSIKDRRLNKLAKIDEILAAVEASGGDPEKIRGKLETDEVLNRLEALEGAMRGAGGTASVDGAQMSGAKQKEFEARTAEILEEAGIPLDDPEVLELKKSPVASEGDWYRKITKLGVQRAKQAGITPSAAVGDKGRPSISKSDQELLDEIEELQASPFENEALIVEKLAEARGRGLFD